MAAAIRVSLRFIRSPGYSLYDPFFLSIR